MHQQITRALVFFFFVKFLERSIWRCTAWTPHLQHHTSSQYSSSHSVVSNSFTTLTRRPSPTSCLSRASFSGRCRVLKKGQHHSRMLPFRWGKTEEDNDVESPTANESTRLISLNNDNGDEEEVVATTPTGTTKTYGSTGEAVLDLAIPALGALLVDPLMNLADTAFVGRYSDTPDALAGMGSAAALLTFSFYLFGFLTKVTTPLVSSKRAAGQEQDAVAVGGQALSLALGMGILLTLALVVGQTKLLSVMGAVDAGPETLQYAKDFLVLRAFAAPAVLVISASTGILRGYLDTKTPIVILVAANLINFALDVILIVFGHMGPLGAAIATTSAEWISALLFLGVLAGKLPSADGELGSNQNESNSASHAKKVIDGDALTIVPTLKFPPWLEIKPLVIASSTVFLRSLVLQVTLSSAAALAARNGDDAAVASLGAHQIGIQLWLLCSFISDALAAASQGLVADALGRGSKSDAREIVKTVFAYSLVLGLVLGSTLYIGSATNFLFDFFTKDNLTQLELARILPLIIFSQPLNSYVFAADGVIEGASEFVFQAQSMLVSVAVTWALFLALSGAGYGDGDILVQVWTSLIVLQLVRGITSSWKIAQKEGPIDILKIPTSTTTR